jgi:tetratricopeptide (TPR) repeat protein
MKNIVRFIASGLLILAFIVNALPCGPAYISPVFEYNNAPENPYENFAAGRIGILKPSLNRSVLFAAYRYLNGGGFTVSEQKALVEVWRADFDNKEFQGNDVSEAVKAWVAKRRDVVGEEAKAPDIYTEREYGGYDFFPNCTKNAFETATETLADRSSSYGSDSKDVKEWVAAQDQVFQNCAGGKSVPDEPDASKAVWLQKDRAYQVAAAKFYSLDYEDAKNRFEQIAQDFESPWRETADYLVGRTLIRQASLVKDSSKASGYYMAAADRLEGIAGGSGKFGDSADGLVGLIKYRLYPKDRVHELAQNLSYSGRRNFRQEVIDYQWLLDKFETETLQNVEKQKEDAELAKFAESDRALRARILSETAALGVSIEVEVKMGGATLNGKVPAAKYEKVIEAANSAGAKALTNNLIKLTEDSEGGITSQGSMPDPRGEKESESLNRGELVRVGVELGGAYTSVIVSPDAADEEIIETFAWGRAGMTDEQKEEVRRTVEAMKAEGKTISLIRELSDADKQKIRAAIKEARADGIKNKFSSRPSYEGGYYGNEKTTLEILPPFLRQDELTDWLFTFQIENSDAYLYSLSKFRQNPSDLWLMTAISKAEKNSPEVARLLDAASRTGRSSPAYPTIAYNVARLYLEQGKTAEARKLLDEILDSPLDLPISSRNKLLGLRLKLAETLEDFIKFSLRKPFAFDFDGTTGTIDEFIAEQKSWYDRDNEDKTQEEYNREIDERWTHEKLWQDREMFDSATIDAINNHFPLSVLIQLESSPALPDYLRDRFALPIFARALLLGDTVTLRKIAPQIVKDHPEFETQINGILNAKTPGAVQNAALFMVLKNPILSPYVEDGLGKDDNELNTWDGDDWWCAPYDTEYDEATGSEVPRSVSKPAFLTAAQSRTGQLERKKLKDLGDAPQYLGRAVLAWAKRSPLDKRIPESLYIAWEANGWTKYGCGNNEEMKAQAGDLLKKRYPSSEWTRKMAEEEQ